jgi:hypothetical protein
MSQSVERPTLSPPQTERRDQNRTLRKLVDGLLEHVRELSHHVDQLSPGELEGERQRFNMIAELMWAVITDEKNKPGVRNREQRTA